MEARPVDSAEDLSHPKNAVRKTYTYFGQSNAQPVPEWGFARDEYAAKIGPRAAITLYAALIGIFTSYLYGAVINLHFGEVIVQVNAE